MAPFTPAYLHLLATGELQRRVETAYARLAACDICPRRCAVNRLAGELGDCRTGRPAPAGPALTLARPARRGDGGRYRPALNL